MLKIQKLRDDVVLPEWTDRGNGGLDIRAIDACVIKKGEIMMIHTGIATEFDTDSVALLRDRSGLAMKGLHVLGGVIDSAYRGEWKVLLVNLGQTDYEIEKGERIAQAIFVDRQHLPIEEVSFLSDTERGSRGFGSSGKF